MDKHYEINMFIYVLTILIFATINIQWGLYQHYKDKRRARQEKRFYGEEE